MDWTGTAWQDGERQRRYRSARSRSARHATAECGKFKGASRRLLAPSLWRALSMLKTFSGRQASQDEAELTGFLRLLQDRGVRRYLEVGARHGDTFHYLMTGLPVGSVGVAVDLPGALW